MDFDIHRIVTRADYIQLLLKALEFAIKQIEDEPTRLNVHVNLLRIVSDSLREELCAKE
ncbi:hypothetical protein J2S10_000198 [Neobacillus ginsengisoli]|uniref:Uncharacterized protein n=1 Tax=Neobacillus ginsengisoli TaxID=904295 RepID=A0ABT9XNH3_9BACI|nr:hypothetical protein [Neobacillus ginsengisoli]